MKQILSLLLALMMAVSVAACGGSDPVVAANDGKWITGDFHTHTFLTDGSHKEEDVVGHAFDVYGLDYMMNSEHGGAYGRDTQGNPWDPSKVTILGDTAKDSSGNPLMWRWQSLRDFSYPLLFGQGGLQSKHQDKTLIQGVEWNVPTHEHASVGIVAVTDGKPIANFEYQFDGADADKSRAGEGLVKQNATHADAVAGAAYLEKNYTETSYFLLNHPSRKQKYKASDIRDFNNASPHVAFGFEGIPGHQKEKARGGYDSTFYTDAGNTTVDQAKTDKARTYGGADIMIARVGGLWDSLLGEGRRFFVFVNSDFHSSADDADFWPGEYGKTYIYAKDKSAQSVVDAMRSGNAFAVHGDLINALDFTVSALGSAPATMGEEFTASKGSNLLIKVRFKSPARNNNGDKPSVHHVDLISGDVTGIIQPGDAKYTSDTNSSTKVIKSFTASDWTVDAEGYTTMSFVISGVQKSIYLRLRGTNLAPNTPNETDKDGNPLKDELAGQNNKAKAYADLWFYSNPIFVKVK